MNECHGSGVSGPAGPPAAHAPAQRLLGPPGFPVPDDLLLDIFGHHLDAAERWDGQ